MNINLRGIAFGMVATAALSLALGVVAAENAIRLEGADVAAHRGSSGKGETIRLEPVVVVAHKPVG